MKARIKVATTIIAALTLTAVGTACWPTDASGDISMAETAAKSNGTSAGDNTTTAAGDVGTDPSGSVTDPATDTGVVNTTVGGGSTGAGTYVEGASDGATGWDNVDSSGAVANGDDGTTIDNDTPAQETSSSGDGDADPTTAEDAPTAEAPDPTDATDPEPTTGPVAEAPAPVDGFSTSCGDLDLADRGDGWHNVGWRDGTSGRELNLDRLGWNPATVIGIRSFDRPYLVSIDCGARPASLSVAEQYVVTACGVIGVKSTATGSRTVFWATAQPTGAQLNLASLGWNPWPAIDIASGGRQFSLAVRCGTGDISAMIE